MTVFTVRCLWAREAAMKAGFLVDILEDVFVVVAIHAQAALPRLVRCVVAFVTLLFVFCMGLDHRARHQQGLQVIRMAVECNEHER